MIVHESSKPLVLAYRHRSSRLIDIDLPTDAHDRDTQAYEVPLTWSPCNFGGRRPWFLCPYTYCRRRVGSLYLARSGVFVCRHCAGIRYESTFETVGDRAWRRKRKAVVRLGGEWDDVWLPRRPKGMHRSTYEELCDRFFEAEDVLDDILIRRLQLGR